ncbi:MAG: heavy metal translocating P-type ATPase [Gemmatimonadetes bacterium]|nr:heavy metal translocating P-type ATPase [Gemmatimonadota bacterium]
MANSTPAAHLKRPTANSHGALSISRLASPAWRFPAAALAALVVTIGLTAADYRWSDEIGIALLVATGGPVVARTARGALRGHFAADIVAALAIVGAIVLWQPVAGLVILLMQTGGDLLERYAEGRASAAVRELEARAPRRANRTRGSVIEVIAVDDIAVGDDLLVRPGEMIPCDGVVSTGVSHLEVARLTGEPSPERVAPGSVVRSGAINLEGAFHMRATALASESLYARIVELVRTAQSEKSPIQRLADRYAVWFTPITIVACIAAWAASGDPLRVLAVLVVATPCPLILATPVAVIGGINRAARHQIVVRSGAALEQIGSVDTAVFDKTGTLTVGYPEVAAVRAIGTLSELDVLDLAAGVEQHSGHLLARSVIVEAERRAVVIPAASNVIEAPGQGVTGMVRGRRVSVGSSQFVSAEQASAAEAIAAARASGHGLRAYVAVDGHAAGVIEYADRTRDGLPQFFAELRTLGVTRILLVSGDHHENVAELAATLGISEARGDMMPDDKVNVVRALLAEGRRVLMTGDGTNDAPALSSATVGIALAAHGGGISAEAADIVLLADDVTRVTTAMQIGRRATGIARQSIVVGLGLSGIAMVAAAMGYIPPTAGALLQEGIDVAVILNALRASRG